MSRAGAFRHAMRPPGGLHTVSEARIGAFEVLMRVEQEGSFASPLLESMEERMSARDRALCHELVLGTLRWQLWLDHLIQYFAKRNPESLDIQVKLALRLGLYQLRYLSRIPASAVLNESVNLAYVSRLRSASGFINAVLRRATRESKYDPAANITDPCERLSIESSHPLWLIERWVNAFGVDFASAFAKSNNIVPPVAFRWTGREQDQTNALKELSAAGAKLTRSDIVTTAWQVEGAGAVTRKLASEGVIHIQDEASQLAAHVVNPRPGELVLDACAAPGGKAALLSLLGGKGCRVVAGDFHERRLHTLVQMLNRQKISNVVPVVLDATVPLPFARATFDCVLLDAPCSGTGTLRRNPEIKWRLSAFDIVSAAQKQERMLRGVSSMVRAGGRLVYSTCSVEREENEEVTAAFLQSAQDFRQVPISADEWMLTATGAVRTWPHVHGCDGFYIACFERRD